MQAQDSFYGIPVWEILVFLGAVALIFIVLVLWWLFGYSYTVVPQVLNSTSTALTLLL
ncbi:MAG: hypothetical protein NTU61_04030 [Candidatus Altiarchaeota archaeon]|nr:hypothetical protein [Candidatus Altiarchaeota archaeon]